jgi:hypothetical protein
MSPLFLIGSPGSNLTDIFFLSVLAAMWVGSKLYDYFTARAKRKKDQPK